MDFIKNLIQRHKWLLFVFIPIDLIIIFLPQWLDAVWGLAEKIKGEPIAMPHPNISWYFITIPVGLIMFGIAIWAVRSKRTIEKGSNNLNNNLTITASPMGTYIRVHKCSQCGWGFKVYTIVLDQAPIICPKCGNVEENTHI